MQSDIKPIVLVVFAALASACSSTPQATPQNHAAAGDVPAIASDAAPAAAAAPAGEVDHNLVKAGYSVMRRHGEVLYCRNEAVTGQRIATRICLTAAQIQDEKQNVTKSEDMMNQSSNRCVGASCNKLGAGK